MIAVTGQVVQYVPKQGRFRLAIHIGKPADAEGEDLRLQVVRQRHRRPAENDAGMEFRQFRGRPSRREGQRRGCEAEFS
jgi:hypothetical protein